MLVEVLEIAADIVGLYLDYDKIQSNDALRKYLDSQVSAYQDLMVSLENEILREVYSARVDEAKAHILTAQEDLDAASRAGSSATGTLELVDDARDDAAEALHSLSLTLQGLKGGCNVELEQTYIEAVAAAFSNAADAGTLKCTAYHMLDELGVPDSSSDRAKVIGCLLELADWALTGIRTVNDSHFVYYTWTYHDGPQVINQYGFKYDGVRNIVSEARAGNRKLNSDAKKMAQDVMTGSMEQRFESLKAVQQIGTIENQLTRGMQAAQATSVREASRQRRAAYQAMRRVPVA
jgi:hypothetical protein